MRAILRRPRPYTPARTFTKFGKRVTVPAAVQAHCQCGRRLGDARPAERALAPAVEPDLRAECPECTPNPPGLSWVVDLPLTKPLSMNDRMDWRVKHRAKSGLRADMTRLVRAAAVPPLAHMTAELHYAPRDKRTRDPLNLAETLKICEDACVSAGIVPDDNPHYVTSTLPVIDAPTGQQGRLYLVIREVQPGVPA